MLKISTKCTQDLFEYIHHVVSNYHTLTNKEQCTSTEVLLSHLACLMEEVGELASEVRKQEKLSFSKKKCNSFDVTNLYLEGIDVLITLCVLLQEVGVENLDPHIYAKIKKNNDRGY